MRKIAVLKWAILWVLGMLSFHVQAQSDSLSSDPAQFFNQLSAILLNTKIPEYKAKADTLLAQFGNRWKEGRLTAKQQQSIREAIEVMRSKHVRTFPYLYQYLHSVNLLSEAENSGDGFMAWQDFIITKLRARQLNAFLNFLDFSDRLIQKHILYNKTISPWHFEDAEFHFRDDSGFYVHFKHLNLIKASHNDSIMVLHTAGNFFYHSKDWEGKGGHLKWNRFGDSTNVKYSIKGCYHFRLSANLIRIDSVQLIYPKFLGKEAVLGKLTDRIWTGKINPNNIYPDFTTFNNISLPQIYPQIAFSGGIELQGSHLYGIGIHKRKAEIIFQRNGKTVLLLHAKRFDFGKNELVSYSADATLLLHKDSIYHPQMKMRYKVPGKKLMLYSISDNAAGIPFIDSYHKLDMYVPSLMWDMNTDSILFKKTRGVNDRQPVRFASNRYFNLRLFYTLQGIDDVNPLYVIQNFMHAYGTTRISVAELSSFMNKPPEQVEGLLMRLSNDGFVIYNSDTREAIATKRMKFFLKAKAGNVDYDVIHFLSDEKLKSNASLSLKDLSLRIYGVPQVFISDSQQVYIYPYDKSITVLKNRNFTFDGKVCVGLFNFYTRKSTFVYDSFKINMNYIDTLSFSVWKNNNITHRRYAVPIKQALNNLTGRLYVDLPFNKSGLMHVPRYPEFVSTSESYVFFAQNSDKDSTSTSGKDTLLPSKRFYYRVSPFVFDSLMTFSTARHAFGGELISDSIFDPISSPLHVMPDYSLGFVYKTPPAGLPVYKGKATYYDSVRLDNDGLHGHGTLRYLTTSVQSKDFRFYPDSLMARKAWHFKGTVDSVKHHFPAIAGDSVKVHWDIPENTMQVINSGADFKVYDKAHLHGAIFLSPGKLSGKGVFSLRNFSLTSHHLLFTDKILNADSAKFILKNANTGDTTFLAKNYHAKIDFRAGKGWFDHLNKNSYLKLPFNGYLSTLNEVEWLMKQNEFILSSTRDEAYIALDSLNRRQLVAYHKPGPEFISINPKMDSLRFYAQKAIYNIGQHTVDVEGVKFIKTGDAAVFPHDGKVTILPEGKLAPLEKADILIDTTHLYHDVYDAQVDILSRRDFKASGKLDYKDMNGTVQPIEMKDVHVSKQGKSIATGVIPKTNVFFLSPEYFFAGTVTMHAQDSLLQFTGGYQLNEDCIDNTGNWMAVNQDIDPRHVTFWFDKSARTADSSKAWFGLAYSHRYHHYYPLVLQAVRDSSDEILISANGRMGIDRKTGNFQMGSPERFKNKDLKANFVELNTKKCEMDGDGIFDMGMKNNMLLTKVIGKFNYFVVPDSTLLNVVLMMTFYFEPQALDLMADSLRVIPGKPVNITDGLYSLALKKLLGPAKANDIINDLSLYGQTKKMPPALVDAITFNDLHLAWDPLSRSFISYGPIGIGNIGANTLNKYMDGILQIRKTDNGSTIEFILRHGKRQWYYFSYANGIMQVLSSDVNFNDIIDNQKEDKRVLNPKSDKNYYEYVLTTRTHMVNFMRSMKRLGKLK